MTSTHARNTAHDSSPDRAPIPTLESRTDRLVRHGRGARLYTEAVVFVALLAGLIVLTSANTRTVKPSWTVGSTHASLVWIIVASAVIGPLLGIMTTVGLRHRTRRAR